jgi:hypothetical protein
VHTDPTAEFLTTGNEHKYGDLAEIDSGAMGIYSNGGHGNANDGKHVTIDNVTYVLDTRLPDSTPGSAFDQNGGVNRRCR